MGELKIKTHTLTDWLSNIRSWVLFTITLAGILVGAVTQIAEMKQQIALLSQKVEILVGDHEKRITNLESEQQLLSHQMDRINALHEQQAHQNTNN
jgi:Tfp pilus assembly protein PilN